MAGIDARYRLDFGCRTSQRLHRTLLILCHIVRSICYIVQLCGGALLLRVESKQGRYRNLKLGTKGYVLIQ